MKLIAAINCPYARKVRVVLAEKRIDHELILDDPFHPDSAAGLHHPLGKVPVLVLDDGSALYDSRLIVEYADSISPVRRLLPDGMRARIDVKRWEALADGIVDAAEAVHLEKGRPTSQQYPDLIRRQYARIQQGMRTLAKDLGSNRWCSGGKTYDLADVAVACAIDYLVFRFPHINLADACPNLADLHARLSALPSFAGTGYAPAAA